MATRDETSPLANGAAAAAILAAGIGCFTLGLVTTLAEAIPALSDALRFVGPVGPLIGKTTVAIVVWLVSWAILHLPWTGRERPFGRIFMVALALILLGVLGTFPLFFELFAG